MEVKLVARTLEIFELFAREARPLSLTDLSRGLDAPVSSTLAMVRTLVNKGYLYETRKRGGYYPTKKLLGASLKIDAGDMLLDLLHPHLSALRDTAGETVVLGKRQGLNVIYLDVVPSARSICYTAEVGEMRPLQANSIGKALLSVMKPEELEAVSAKLKWQRYTPTTVTSAAEMLEAATRSAAQGWAENIGESVPDLAAIAVPFPMAGEWYAVSIVGPIGRMQASWDVHVAQIKNTVDALMGALRSHQGEA